MQRTLRQKLFLNACVAVSSLLIVGVIQAQDIRHSASSSPGSSESQPEIRALADSIRDLQATVQQLTSQVSELREEQRRTSEESSRLRDELNLAKAEPAAGSYQSPLQQYSAPPARENSVYIPPSASSTSGQNQAPVDRIGKLEEDQEITDTRLNEQNQTKVESGSKYRVRLSGIALLNLYENRGLVDNQDFPQLAQPPNSEPLFVSPGSFGGSLRQSQIKLEAFGPDLAGAHTSASVDFDFAGGFPETWNGVSMGLVRLRTGTMRMDWADTSVVAGQDHLFFAPLAPTSLATLAQPALSYTGNLWAWTPQVRVEHRFRFSDTSSIELQAGILDSLTGDTPEDDTGNYRYPSWGEESGQPAYATRVAWSHRTFSQNFTVGMAGYYGRQNWGFGRDVDGWAGMTDVTVPLGKLFEFTGEFYRGRALAGLGGGIGQSVLLNGSFIAPATTFKGLDSMGGWAQLKFKARPNLEFNAALGIDNPFAVEMRRFQTNSIYDDLYSRNLSPLINFIYQVRSDILFSLEYRYIQTTVLDSGSNSVNHINMSLGYIF